MRHFRRRARRSSGARKRKLFWDGGHVTGELNLGTSPGNSMQYCFWIRWPAGQRQTTDETGILRNGELTTENVTLERMRWIIGYSFATPTNLSAYRLVFGATVYESWIPSVLDNVVQTGGGDGGPNENPDPSFDLNEDWIFRRVDILETGGGGGAQLGFVRPPDNIDAYQSRAKRKLGPGQGILGVISAISTVEDDELDIILAMDIRCLYRSGNYPG